MDKAVLLPECSREIPFRPCQVPCSLPHGSILPASEPTTVSPTHISLLWPSLLPLPFTICDEVRPTDDPGKLLVLVTVGGLNEECRETCDRYLSFTDSENSTHSSLTAYGKPLRQLVPLHLRKLPFDFVSLLSVLRGELEEVLSRTLVLKDCNLSCAYVEQHQSINELLLKNLGLSILSTHAVLTILLSMYGK